jgi:hypothetical protein
LARDAAVRGAAGEHAPGRSPKVGITTGFDLVRHAIAMQRLSGAQARQSHAGSSQLIGAPGPVDDSPFRVTVTLAISPRTTSSRTFLDHGSMA